MNAGFDRLNPVLQHHIVNSLGWPGLRPLQEAAVEPLLQAQDALLLAPTAGGKTEAALFPLLTRMQEERWPGTSIIYVTPLKALLNNLAPRIETYAKWLGRTVGVRHGDTTAGERQRLLRQHPDILLTTPESLEAMLVSTKVTPEDAFGDVKAIVVDEIHAFAGDDRGWHLKALIDRLGMIVGLELHRVGLSATVGNPEELLAWLQGGKARWHEGVVVAPRVGAPLPPDLQLDFVGNLTNAATVVSSLHRGEKRLVFCESRRQVESFVATLRPMGVETYLSHSSLSADERRIAETAFTHARDCVITATSTLELGIDVGDLDRVIQLGAPNTVSATLQRLGRTGRRLGTTRNMLFLGIEDADFLLAAAVLQLWSEDFVEPITPPPDPVHVLAQQMLALTLQHGRMSESELVDIGSLFLGGEVSEQILTWLEETGHLDRDGDFLMVGPAAERRYGRFYFRDLVAVFTAPPQFQVLEGRNEIGLIDPQMLTRPVAGPRVITLGGRSWKVGHIDWKRRRAYVEATDLGGNIRWVSSPRADSFWVTDATRRVLLGREPSGVRLTSRATERLAQLRAEYASRVDDSGSIVVHDDRGPVWWTWAGAAANAVLAAALQRVAPEIVADGAYNNRMIRLARDARATALAAALRALRAGDLAEAMPSVTADAVRGLKFAEMLPPELAVKTLAVRGADHRGAEIVASRPVTDVAGG